ncbi:WD repeat domain 31 [Trypanosoma conorhini]|uniref:WD repeat domain 31 n=1 Tax=Trypanosoma conorhini TaxID=83891 RepID=A0A3R7LGN0_9TRYP|nr:WD repeat domain 31 [Trypanosoma conorhini]RNF26920.1 WD repeat domain 31 [Trypanosoma conorhini]
MGLLCFRGNLTCQKSVPDDAVPPEHVERRSKVAVRMLKLTSISQLGSPAPLAGEYPEKTQGPYSVEGHGVKDSRVSGPSAWSVPSLTHMEYESFAGVFAGGGAALALQSCEDANMPHHLILAGEDGSLVLVNYETGETVRRWCGAHGRDVNALTRPLSSGIFASASRDKLVKVWELHCEEAVCELRGHTANVTGATMVADNNFLVSGSRDNTVRLWDLEQAEEVQRGDIKQNIVQFVRWVPQLRCVAQGGEDLTVRLWDVRMSASGHKALGLSLASTLTCIDYHPICCELLPGEEGTGLLTGHNGFNGHGAYVLQWDLRMQKCLRTFHGHSGTVRSIRIRPQPESSTTQEFMSTGDDEAIVFFSMDAASAETVVIADPRRMFKLNEGRVTCLDARANGDIFASTWSGAVVVLRPTSPDGEITMPVKRYRCFGAEGQPS